MRNKIDVDFNVDLMNSKSELNIIMVLHNKDNCSLIVNRGTKLIKYHISKTPVIELK